MNSVQGYRAHAFPPALCLRHSLLGPTGPLACLVASFAAPSYIYANMQYVYQGRQDRGDGNKGAN